MPNFDKDHGLFFAGTHPLSSLQKELSAQFVPLMGACASVEAEVMRAASRIYYERYNNGGYQNKSAEVNFLLKHGPDQGLRPEILANLRVHFESFRDWMQPPVGFLDELAAQAVLNLQAKAAKGEFTPLVLECIDPSFHEAEVAYCSNCGTTEKEGGSFSVCNDTCDYCCSVDESMDDEGMAD